MKKDDIDIVLRPLANKCKKQKISKSLVIQNIRELIKIVGYDVEFINPSVTWTSEYFVPTIGKKIKWEEINEHSFANISWYKKILILVAGVFMNAVLAVVIFLSIAFSYNTATTKITGFAENSVLEQAGVSVGDTIQTINGNKTKKKF